MTMRKGVYVVPTDRWYIERTVWLIAGVVLLASTLLAVLVNPLWIFGVIATGLVSINVALTGFCPIGNALKLIGFKAALGVPNTKLYFLQTDSWYLERRIYVTVGVNITLGSILFLLQARGGACSPVSSAPPWCGSRRQGSAFSPTSCSGSAPNRGSIRARCARAAPPAPSTPDSFSYAVSPRRRRRGDPFVLLFEMRKSTATGAR